MRLATIATFGLLLGLLAPSAYARSAPPGIDPNAKDPCKNGVQMLKDTCDQKCDKGPKKKVASCKADCTSQQKRFAVDCPNVIKGKKTQDEVRREDREHKRGLDKPSTQGGSSVETHPTTQADLQKAGVGG